MNAKALLTAVAVLVASVSLAPTDADARRLGGGGSAGMQRSLPSQSPPMAAPARPAQTAPAAAPATAGTPAAAAAPRRSWLGPIAGLAAGLGLAALMSHLGFGAEFANILMIVLLGVVAIVAIRFLLRRFGPASSSPAMKTPDGMQFRDTGTTWQNPVTPPASSAPLGSSAGVGTAIAAPSTTSPVRGRASIPADFDTAGFERIAKMIFIRLQAANDAGDLNDLRTFTTPELFASIRLDLQDRAASQQTDVVKVDAEVLDVTTEAERQLVSVRFHGLIREERDGVAAPFDEVWHLVRPVDGSREWAIAGIQQMA